MKAGYSIAATASAVLIFAVGLLNAGKKRKCGRRRSDRRHSQTRGASPPSEAN
jgi:hypothetical protein